MRVTGALRVIDIDTAPERLIRAGAGGIDI